jgi:EAL domain-containing protein (putative c-di-GMP-specific phosphodiesterase class I)
MRERQAGNVGELRLFVPVAAGSVIDAAFAPWLAAECGTHGIASSSLVLEFEAVELRGDPARLRGALESLQRVGVRLAVNAGNDASEECARLLDMDALGVVRFARLGDADAGHQIAWEPWANTITKARSLGKVTVGVGTTGMADIGSLLRMGVHYAQGDALGGWLADWTFDFAEAVL